MVTKFEVEDTVNKWKQEGQTLIELVANGKKVTSGTVFRANKVLIDKEIINILLEKEHLKDNELHEKIQKEIVEYYTLCYYFRKTLESNPTLINLNTETLNAANSVKLKEVMKWFYCNGDENLPKVKKAIIQQITKH